MKHLLILSILFLSSCLFSEQKDLIFQYKLNEDTSFLVYSVGYGATTRDHTEIIQVRGSNKSYIKRVDYGYHDFKPEITRINDTLFKITFTDTGAFKGRSISYNFNVNDRIKN